MLSLSSWGRDQHTNVYVLSFLKRQNLSGEREGQEQSSLTLFPLKMQLALNTSSWTVCALKIPSALPFKALYLFNSASQADFERSGWPDLKGVRRRRLGLYGIPFLGNTGRVWANAAKTKVAKTFPVLGEGDYELELAADRHIHCQLISIRIAVFFQFLKIQKKAGSDSVHQTQTDFFVLCFGSDQLFRVTDILGGLIFHMR